MTSDYVKEDTNIEEIRNYIRGPHFMMACRYCYGIDRVVKLSAGEKNKKKMEMGWKWWIKNSA